MNLLILTLALLACHTNANVRQKRESHGNDEQGGDDYQEQVKSCPALRLGTGVAVEPASCADGARQSGAICHFSCKRGYRVRGPPVTVCHDDGSWLYGHRDIQCVDINECNFRKGGCSHKCVNTNGGHYCECPHPLVLDKDGKNCRAVGLVLNCTAHNIEIIIPKYVLSNLQGDYLQLRDPSCHPRENSTHYIFNMELNGCGTTRRHTRNFIVYSNKVTEKSVAQHGVITRVGNGEFKIPFCCYYLDNGIVSSVGYKPFVRELVLKEKGYGKFKLRMDFFRTQNYQSEYTWDDFPVSVYLRERLYFEVSIDSIDQNLVVFAGNCCATPTRDHYKAGRFRHEIIHEGCIVDSTTQREPSPSPHRQRFSIEAFKFVGKFPFVYLHCSVIVCKADDPNSRCSKGCIPGLHRGKPMNRPFSKRNHIPKSHDTPETASKTLQEKAPIPEPHDTPKAASKNLQEKAPIPEPHDTPKAASKNLQEKAPIPEPHDTPKAASKNLQKKAPIRRNRSIEKPAQLSAKREKDHKYLLSKGPVSLLEEEPDVERAEDDAKAPEMNQLDDVEQDVNDPEKKKEKSSKEQKAASTTDILLITLVALTILALLGVLHVGRKVNQASNRGHRDYKPMKS